MATAAGGSGGDRGFGGGFGGSGGNGGSGGSGDDDRRKKGNGKGKAPRKKLEGATNDPAVLKGYDGDDDSESSSDDNRSGRTLSPIHFYRSAYDNHPKKFPDTTRINSMTRRELTREWTESAWHQHLVRESDIAAQKKRREERALARHRQQTVEDVGTSMAELAQGPRRGPLRRPHLAWDYPPSLLNINFGPLVHRFFQQGHLGRVHPRFGHRANSGRVNPRFLQRGNFGRAHPGSSQRGHPRSSQRGNFGRVHPRSSQRGNFGRVHPGSSQRGNFGRVHPGSSQRGNFGRVHPGSSQRGNFGRVHPGSSQRGNFGRGHPRFGCRANFGRVHPGSLQRGNFRRINPGSSQRGNFRRINPGSSQRGNFRRINPGSSQRGNFRRINPGSSQRGNFRRINPGSSQRGNLDRQNPGSSQRNQRAAGDPSHVEQEQNLGQQEDQGHVLQHQDLGHVVQQEDLGQEDQGHVEQQEDLGQEDQGHVDQQEDLGQEDLCHVEQQEDQGYVDQQEDKGHVEQQEDLGQEYVDQQEDLGQEDQGHVEQQEDLGQEDQGHVEQQEDLGQEYVDQQEDLGQEDQGHVDQQEDQGHVDQLEDLGQEDQGYVDQLEDLGQEDQGYVDQLEDLGQEDQGYVDQLEDLGQGDQGYVDQLEDLGQEDQGHVEQQEDLGQEYVDQLEDLGQEDQGHIEQPPNLGQEDQGHIEQPPNLGQEDQGHIEQPPNLGQEGQGHMDQDLAWFLQDPPPFFLCQCFLLRHPNAPIPPGLLSPPHLLPNPEYFVLHNRRPSLWFLYMEMRLVVRAHQRAMAYLRRVEGRLRLRALTRLARFSRFQGIVDEVEQLDLDEAATLQRDYDNRHFTPIDPNEQYPVVVSVGSYLEEEHDIPYNIMHPEPEFLYRARMSSFNGSSPSVSSLDVNLPQAAPNLAVPRPSHGLDYGDMDPPHYHDNRAPEDPAAAASPSLRIVPQPAALVQPHEDGLPPLRGLSQQAFNQGLSLREIEALPSEDPPARRFNVTVGQPVRLPPDNVASAPVPPPSPVDIIDPDYIRIINGSGDLRQAQSQMIPLHEAIRLHWADNPNASRPHQARRDQESDLRFDVGVVVPVPHDPHGPRASTPSPEAELDATSSSSSSFEIISQELHRVMDEFNNNLDDEIRMERQDVDDQERFPSVTPSPTSSTSFVEIALCEDERPRSEEQQNGATPDSDDKKEPGENQADPIATSPSSSVSSIEIINPDSPDTAVVCVGNENQEGRSEEPTNQYNQAVSNTSFYYRRYDFPDPSRLPLPPARFTDATAASSPSNGGASASGNGSAKHSVSGEEEDNNLIKLADDANAGDDVDGKPTE